MSIKLIAVLLMCATESQQIGVRLAPVAEQWTHSAFLFAGLRALTEGVRLVEGDCSSNIKRRKRAKGARDENEERIVSPPQIY